MYLHYRDPIFLFSSNLLVEEFWDSYMLVHWSEVPILGTPRSLEISINNHDEYNLRTGNVVIPKRDSETFISAIGHFDRRLDLFKIENLSGGNDFEKITWEVEMGNRALMDLCMMASKLAYENAKVVRNIVELRWKVWPLILTHACRCCIINGY